MTDFKESMRFWMSLPTCAQREARTARKADSLKNKGFMMVSQAVGNGTVSGQGMSQNGVLEALSSEDEGGSLLLPSPDNVAGRSGVFGCLTVL